MKKGSFTFPHTIALLFILICFAGLLTYILPAGEFDSEKVDNTTRVIAGTYHTIAASPQGPWAWLNAVVLGFQKTSVLFAMILFTGSAVHVLQQSGAVEVAFKSIARGGKLGDAAIIFFIMLFMSIGGATGVFANATVALIPIGMMLSAAMGLDAAAGFAMVYLGAYSGFNVGWANPSTLGVAHPIAELPVFSGMNVRVVMHIVNFLLNFVFVMMYVRNIRKDYTKSLNYTPGSQKNDVLGVVSEKSIDPSAKMTRKQLGCFLTIIAAVAFIMIGSIAWKFGNQQIAAIMLLAIIVQGIILGLDMNGITRAFIEGCKPMLAAAFIVGFANAISVVMANGKILHTIVYYLSIPISAAGPVVGSVLMFWANLIINLFIPSGSGQAAAVMPLMVPISDLTGITRQVAVQAFQFGDGLSNCIVPTAGTIMGSLGIAGIAYDKYAKWYAPFLLLQCIVASAALVFLQTIGWMGI